MASNVVCVAQTEFGRLAYLSTDQYVGGALAQASIYSPGEIQLFRQILRPGDGAIEVGAHFGSLTIPIAKAVGPTGKVFAFEPQDCLYRLLVANTALNETWNVEVLRAAVSNRTGVILVPRLDPAAPQNFGGLTLTGEGQDTVPMMTLDAGQPKGKIRLLKIDVEGMELEVLQGGSELIKKHRPVIYAEGDRVEKVPALLEWLASNGYDAYWHVTPLTPVGDLSRIVSINLLCLPSDEPKDLAKGCPPATDANWKGAYVKLRVAA